MNDKRKIFCNDTSFLDEIDSHHSTLYVASEGNVRELLEQPFELSYSPRYFSQEHRFIDFRVRSFLYLVVCCVVFAHSIASYCIAFGRHSMPIMIPGCLGRLQHVMLLVILGILSLSFPQLPFLLSSFPSSFLLLLLLLLQFH